MGASKRSNHFEQTADEYRILIRWGEFEKAQNYSRLRLDTEAKFDREFYQNIRVTRYELVDQIAVGDDPEDPREIRLIIDLDFNQANEVTVHTLRYEQLWWYDENTERWFLDGQLPDFKKQINADRQVKTRTYGAEWVNQ